MSTLHSTLRRPGSAQPVFGRPLPTAPGVPAPAPRCALERTGFDLGRDHARWGLVPPAEHLHPGHPVREGWAAGRATFAGRSREATVPVRRWLALRLAAWRRGQAVDLLQVTPALLRRLHTDTCPVTGQRLSQDAGADSDALVVALRPEAAIGPGHLVLMSRRAAQAWRQRTAHEALAIARGLDEAEPGGAEERRVDGLDADGWWRLATLLSFVTPLPQAQAAALALRAWPTARLRLVNPVQSLQVLLTLAFTDPDAPPPVQALAALAPATVHSEFQVFMHTLLARRVAAGAVDRAGLKRALGVAWGQPLVQRRWTRLALALSAADCEVIVERALQRGLVHGLRRLSPAMVDEGWAVAEAVAPAAVARPRAVRTGRPATAAVQRALPLG
jgi:hypothetical protein